MSIAESRWDFLWRHCRAPLALLIVLLPLTRGAIRSFPLYDDAGFQLIVKENGVNSVRAALTNRPVFGWLFQKAILSPYYQLGGFVLQFVGWALFGMVTMWLWNKLFPELRRYAPLAACLAVAPILVKSQMETWLFVLPVNLAVIPAYAAGLILWRYVEENNHLGYLMLGLSALMTFAGAMLSEYAFLATIASSFFLISLAWPADKARRIRVIQSVGALAISALIAHFLFARIADAHPTYGTVSFAPPVSEIILHLPTYLARVLRAFWHATVGAYGQALAAAAGQSARENISPGTILYPLAVGCILMFVCWPGKGEQGSPGKATVGIFSWGRAAAFALALAATLAPAYLFRPVLMGRDLHLEELGTRVYFVAAPLAVALTLRMLLAILRHRYWFVLPLALGFLAGDAVLKEVSATASAIHTMKQIGPVLEPYVKANPDLTVVLTPDYYARDVEVTYRASASWPADLSRRLLILWDGRLPTVMPGHHAIRGEGCAQITSVNRNMDTIIRRGKIGQLLWLQPTPSGGFAVEPYCITGGN